MNLYLDTSALVKLYVAEEGSAQVRIAFQQAVLAMTSTLTFAEVQSALAKKLRTGEIAEREYEMARGLFNESWPGFFTLSPRIEIIEAAASLIHKYRALSLRAYEAVQLASALELQSYLPNGVAIGTPAGVEVQASGPVVFLSADDAQVAAASQEGLQIQHIRLE